MLVVLQALGVSLAAFCVWLAVRIVNRRERWAKWTAVAIVFLSLVAYPLSYPWACSALYHQHKNQAVMLDQTAEFYAPFGWAFQYWPAFAQNAYFAYSNCCLRITGVPLK